MEELHEIGTLLARKLTAFLHTLRDNAFPVGLGEGQDAAALLATGYGATPNLLRSAFKHLFSTRKADWDKFDNLFDAFWLGRGMHMRSNTICDTANPAAAALVIPAESGARENTGLPVEGFLSDHEASTEAGSSQAQAEGASRAENLAQTDFRMLSDPADIAAVHTAVARIAQILQTRLTRRDRARQHGERLDLRRTIHRSVAQGGLPVRLVWRQRKEKPLRLVVLLDSSASMNLYTGFFLRFIHGVLDEFCEAEAFLFHTHLVHVSDAMKERDAARALDRLSMIAQGVGGGTRIGECLQSFNRWHANRMLHSRCCVMIVSDGYETGDAALLACEMAALRRRCRRIVWLNPMMGWDGYAPTAQGIQAALPHVDLLAPAHNLQSLAALEPYLARL